MEENLIHNKEWFISMIGQRVYRGPVDCQCESCRKGTEEGIIVVDEMHAQYLFDVQNEIGIRYNGKLLT